MQHLTIRVPWHDNQWNGSICEAPINNSFCTNLDRIRMSKNDEEELLKGQSWSNLSPEELPPCITESGGFMNDKEWIRIFSHPYKNSKKVAATHSHLENTKYKVAAYSSFAVPFAWMLTSNQERIDEKQPAPLPADEEAPFNTPWVFGRERQGALVDLIFNQLDNRGSLVFYYCKSGHPLGDNINRLIVGVGRIIKVEKTLFYKTNLEKSYPIWDRNIQHSIRPDGNDGFLLPYHEYLKPTGNEEEDRRRQELLAEIIVEADPTYTRVFSYAAELAKPDVALSTLVRCLESVRKIREHGIVDGPWEQREEWLNEQIALAWRDRGAFPGIGSALEAIGMRLGTALAFELFAKGEISNEDDPWFTIDEIIKGIRKPPQEAYRADLNAIKSTWLNLSDERKALLKLLSRFDLSPSQAKRWFQAEKRAKATEKEVKDHDILLNPYIISEADLGDFDEAPVSISVIDRGVLPDSKLAALHPIPEPSLVSSIMDARRVRAIIVHVLRKAADEGDTLLSINEIIERISSLKLTRYCEITFDWIEGNKQMLEGVVEVIKVVQNPERDDFLYALQLTEFKKREEKMAKKLRARAEFILPKIEVNWSELIIKSIKESEAKFDFNNKRHVTALEEQSKALESITSRKLSVLIGRAGTGKTSVLGALLQCEELVRDGILLLAPTGKARVRLGNVANAEAKTIAQFLNQLKRYDTLRQLPLFAGDLHRAEKTIVIDECSMLNMNFLYAVIEAIDPGHVKRIILVGDPNQLPPIGAGRPFADLVASLEEAKSLEDVKNKHYGAALAQLSVEVRALTTGNASDTLRLASWFTREPQTVDADRVLNELDLGTDFNDLEICYWESPNQLRDLLLRQFIKDMKLENAYDQVGFNKALGFNEKGMVQFSEPNGVDAFQVLSPVRNHPYGVHDLNRWIQQHFRAGELKKARDYMTLSLGDEEIVLRDKVIQIRNQRRVGYDWGTREEVNSYLANGETGIVANEKHVKNNKFLNVLFSKRPNLTVGYQGKEFPQGNGPLELAYALTVHKSQGSEFGVVFVVIPKNSRLLSREMIYTALTRSRQKLVLLVEGNNASSLFDLSSPEKSETLRRNTNLFRGVVRSKRDTVPYAKNLIHLTEKGHLVRSKSELVISNMLYRMDIEYHYERPLEANGIQYKIKPDFTFFDYSGEPIIWEHLGMLNKEDYRAGWEWKKAWYLEHGFVEGQNLFTTRDDDRGGLDSTEVRNVAERINELI
jgi:ATP-dependent exoDNAse (exonuclease V) alpha subunit